MLSIAINNISNSYAFPNWMNEKIFQQTYTHDLHWLRSGKMVSNGFTLAIIVLVFMVFAVIFSLWKIYSSMNSNTAPKPRPTWMGYATPVLCVVGIGVAFYLSYVETQKVSVICGPIGDCNSVNNSPYAKIFGILPVGVLGLAGYCAILISWLWATLRKDRIAEIAPLAIFGMALFGTLFSIYLTYLEPFVIKAVCMWCLSSAVIITLLLLNSLPSAITNLVLVEEDED